MEPALLKFLSFKAKMRIASPRLFIFAFNWQYEYNYTLILPEMFTMANVNNTCRLADPLKVRAEACFFRNRGDTPGNTEIQ
jgi:hypothetical protein